MNYRSEQHKAAADANAETLVCVLGAAQLRYLHPTLSYRESLALVRKMSVDKRLTLVIAVVRQQGFPFSTYLPLADTNASSMPSQSSTITHLIASCEVDTPGTHKRTREVPIDNEIWAALVQQ